jgi:(S)-ureidoglycine aminohydrolase
MLTPRSTGVPQPLPDMYPKLGLTRNVIRPHYALITPDGHVPSQLPGWTNTTAHVILSSAIGAGLTQLLLQLPAGGRGHVTTGPDEWFLYLISGAGTLDGTALTTGSYAWIPPDQTFSFEATAATTQLLVFRKTYEPLEGHPPGPRLTGHPDTIPAVPFLGDPCARLQTLLPDNPAADMAVNLFTYDPGATLPFVETHVMEHGMLFLEGSGVYRLGDDWHPVTAGDALWIAPYCPQWFIAAGPQPATYIYYKDINRPPA